MDCKLAALLTALQKYARPAVAFSGGVDSTVLLRAALETHAPQDVLALTAFSPSMPAREKAEIGRLVAEMGVPHHFLETDELRDPDYRRNDRDRCYFCKRRLFRRMLEHAEAAGCDVLLDGSNADDLTVWRPGRQALAEYEIPSPLADAGLRKAEVREIARRWQLSVAEKPSTPCLASRFAYALELTEAGFAQVEAAEEFLEALLASHGMKSGDGGGVRVRVHPGELARVEVPPEFFELLTRPAICAAVTAEFHRLGFRFITLDLDGFRSGCYD